MTVIVDYDQTGAQTLQAALGTEAVVLPNVDALRRHLDTHLGEDAVVVGAHVDLESALDLAGNMRLNRPSLGVVLVRRRVDTSVLADALRAGVREVVEERDLAGLNAAVARVRELARALRDQVPGNEPPEGTEGRGSLITVFSAKGGCGKTTLATNLAASLADNGRHEVCLVDLDLSFGDVAIALQIFPSHTIADAVTLGVKLDADAVDSLLTPHSPGLTTLVAPVEPGATGISAELVGRILDLLRERFEFVVVDTPPAFDDQVLAAFDRSDLIALIATLDIPALKNLKLTLETLALLNYPREKWAVLLNRADSKVGLALNEVEKTLKVPISAQIPSSRDVPASINRGVPIVLDDPKHPVSLAIKQFAQRSVIPVNQAESSIPADLRADRRGFLRRKAKTS
ncbi:MAG: P-loop NTPase [Actinomycetota bacterium]|nr:P-loop NTPase [Actinomycetota bacterium]MDH5278647.1 P-loop NTPase [Actinomycetota bacterium]